jgi:xylulokinase
VSKVADAIAGEVVLGIDLGTSSVKALLVELASGRCVGSGTHPYESSLPFAEAHEQDVDRWWTATVAAVQGALADAPSSVNVRGIGLSGHMHSLALIGHDDRPVRPVMTWADRRSTAQVERLRREADQFERRTANPVVEAFTAPKLAWLAEHEPAALAAATRLVLAKDVLRHRLTGTWGTDTTDAWGTLLYDIGHDRFSPELFALTGASAELAPAVVGPATVVGELQPAAAEELGLEVGTPTVAGASDVSCSALGAGVLRPGTALINAGTAAQILVPSHEPLVGDYFVFAEAGGPGSLRMASVYAAGLAIDWAGRTLLGLEGDNGDSAGSAVDALATAAEPGGDGVSFVPHLLGSSVPTSLPAVTGALLGLRPGHVPADVARAVVEGVAFACLDAVQHLVHDAGGSGAIHLAGGLSRSSVWASTIATVSDGPVQVHRGEASPLGAAMLAGIGIGAWPDREAAVAACVEMAAVAPATEQRPALLAGQRRWSAAQRCVLQHAEDAEVS